MNITGIIVKLQSAKTHYQAKVDEINEKITELDKGITALKMILCPDCNGTGWITCMDAAGSISNERCETCKGTGIFENYRED